MIECELYLLILNKHKQSEVCMKHNKNLRFTNLAINSYHIKHNLLNISCVFVIIIIIFTIITIVMMFFYPANTVVLAGDSQRKEIKRSFRE